MAAKYFRFLLSISLWRQFFWEYFVFFWCSRILYLSWVFRLTISDAILLLLIKIWIRSMCEYIQLHMTMCVRFIRFFLLLCFIFHIRSMNCLGLFTKLVYFHVVYWIYTIFSAILFVSLLSYLILKPLLLYTNKK